MVKNIFLLFLLTWVSLSYAKGKVAQESMKDSESYKWDKPVQEQEVQRGVAGGKIKKNRMAPADQKVEPTEESDSEVRYWKFQE